MYHFVLFSASAEESEHQQPFLWFRKSILLLIEVQDHIDYWSASVALRLISVLEAVRPIVRSPLHSPVGHQSSFKMRKFFHKLETNTSTSSIGNQSLNAGIVNNDPNQIKEFIGKSFAVGRYNVVVEDVIAEGEALFSIGWSMLKWRLTAALFLTDSDRWLRHCVPRQMYKEQHQVRPETVVRQQRAGSERLQDGDWDRRKCFLKLEGSAWALWMDNLFQANDSPFLSQKQVAGHKNCVCLIESAIKFVGEGKFLIIWKSKISDQVWSDIHMKDWFLRKA